MNLSHWLKSFRNSGSSHARQSSIARRSKRWNLLEQLESRQLLTTITASIVGNNLVIEDTDVTGKANVLSLIRSEANLIISDANEQIGTAISGAVLSNGDRTVTIPASALGAGGKIIVKGQGRSDSLTVDVSTDLGFDVEFQGGTGTSDSLTLAADTVTSVTHAFTNANDGSVTIVDGGPRIITYTGVEQITDNLNATDRVFNFPAGVSNATLADDLGGSGNGLSRLSSVNNGAGLFAIDATTDSLYRINPATGAATLVGALGVNLANTAGAAADPFTGTIYMTSDGAGASLFTVNPNTGLATVVGPLGVNIPGLAIDTDTGVLYGISGQTDSLYTINTTTGAATLVGAMGVNVAFNGAAYDTVSNKLYMENGTSLYTVNTATGVASLVGANGVSEIFGIEYDAQSGILYGVSRATDQLHSINTATGAATSIGALGVNFANGIGLGILNTGFAATTFANPTGSVTINRGNASDVITVGALPDLNATLNVGSTANSFSSVTLSGAVNLAAGNNLSISANSLTATATGAIAVSGGGSITANANNVDINATATLNAGTGTATFAQLTANRPINLGTNTASSLSLTDAELDRITAGTINIGNTNSGTITFSAEISRTSSTNVNLTTGSGNNIAFGTFSLNALSGGDVSLTTSGTGAITTGDNTGTDITVDDVTLIAGSNGIGSTTNFLRLAATTVTATTSGNGSINLVEADSVTIAANDLNAGSATITLGSGSFLTTATGSILSPVTVASGATLGGTGTTAAITTQSGGIIAPGTSPGTLNTGNLSLVSGSTFQVEAESTANFDKMVVAGTVSLGNATLNVAAFGTAVVNGGDGFVIIDNDGTSDAVTDTFNGLAEGTIVSTDFLGSGKTARITYVGGDGNDVAISLGGVDTTAPTATVRPLPLTTTISTITLTIDTIDPAGAVGEAVSGVASYDVYVAVDSGGWSLFADDVPASQSMVNFTPSSNHRYWFRAVAKDNAGNTEVESAIPISEANSFVTDFVPPNTAVVSATVDANGLFTLNLQGSDVGGSTVNRFRVFVKIDDGAAVEIPQTNVAAGTANGSGVHSAATSYQGLRDGASHTYTFFTRAVDSKGNLEAAPTDANADIRQTHTFAAPTALAATDIDVQNGQTQRSYIRTVDVLFNDVTSLQSLIDNNRIRVERFALDDSTPDVGTGTNVNISGATVSGNSIKLDFGAGGLGGVGRAGNGFYRILVDTDGDGSFNDSMFEFFRLYGDSNGDGKITSVDGTVTEDLSGDGLVNATDRAIWRRETSFKLLDSLFANLDD